MPVQDKLIAESLFRVFDEDNSGSLNFSEYLQVSPRRSSVANAGGRPFCQELGMGWVHIGQWIFSISAISHALFWRNCVFCVFTL